MSNNEETLLKFPCQFPIKVMGLNNLEFEARVLAIVRKHVPELSEAAVETRLSKDSKYEALTITIEATSKAQLDAIYLELNSDKLVLMTL